jgi:hypothetical protein
MVPSSKKRIVPWGSFDKCRPLCETLHDGKLIAFVWNCRFASCFYAFPHYDGVEESRVIKNRMDQHLKMHFPGWDKIAMSEELVPEEENKLSVPEAMQRAKSLREWVFAVLKSGAPYTPLCRSGEPIYSYLRYHDVPTRLIS